MSKAKETPLMKQYNSIKVKYPDACLLFRVGDFYETFGEDAIRASKILGIVLTKRGNGSESETALAGFPHHSLNTYLPKLVKAGLRVAICDQLEDPKMTKTIVKRGVTELVTPGVAMNDEVLQQQSNNFLASLYFNKNSLGVSFLDVSTGEFLVSQGSVDYIDKLLQNFQPSEILIPRPFKKDFAEHFGNHFHAFFVEEWVYQLDYAQEKLNTHFQTNSLKGFGIENLEDGIIAAGAILYYLSETQHHKIQHISTIQRISEEAYVWMDRFTIRNLELYRGSDENAVTLLGVIDKTTSPMGSRLLKRWLALPLKDINQITKRQDVVAHLLSHSDDLFLFETQIKKISDIERLISKVAAFKISPRELIFLLQSLDAIIPIKQAALKSENESLKMIGDQLHSCDLLREKIKASLNEDAPVAIQKGHAIATGVNNELDELRKIAFSGKEYLAELERREVEKTGISSLKVAFNNVFGYYIEVRNTHKDKVPVEWTRKQTLVNAERYITEELKIYEEKILGAEEKISQLETEIFNQLVQWISGYIKQVQINAQLIAQLDCLLSFAKSAKQNNYCRPELTSDKTLDIKEGRHPVIEKQLPKDKPFIANDVFLENDSQQIIMITGPNMSGKSALLRQTALIVLMAQMGSYVPAKEVKMGIVDKIFTRVGASDNISMGESTFMVEMNETASILNNLTDRSLIILDEIGRGTSTYDGLSLAQSILEFILKKQCGFTFFATHYHELTSLESQNPFRLFNVHMGIEERGQDIYFLHTLKKGPAMRSYGIHVGRLAGLPEEVIKRSKQLLKSFEQSSRSPQLSLFDSIEKFDQEAVKQEATPVLPDWVIELKQLNLNEITPLGALQTLFEMKKKASDRPPEAF